MNPRRRRVRDRIARDRKRKEESAKFLHSLACIRRAVEDAIARGDTQVTPRVSREAQRHLIAVRTK